MKKLFKLNERQSYSMAFLGILIFLVTFQFMNCQFEDVISDLGNLIDKEYPGTPSTINTVSDTNTNGLSISWSAPEETGVMSDGTNLSKDKLEYRVYYMKEISNNQAIPNPVDVINGASGVQTKLIETQAGQLSVNIDDLESDTRYFIVILAYNPVTGKSTKSSDLEVIDIKTKDLPVLTGEFSYPALEFSYTQNQGIQVINPTSVPSASGGETVSYSIRHSSGVEFNPAVEVDPALGNVTVITSTSITGTGKYQIIASADGYNSQTVDLTIQISEQGQSGGTELTGTLSYGATRFEYTQDQMAQIVPTVTVPVASGGEFITYSISHKSGLNLDSFINIEQSSGLLLINPSTSEVGTAVYTVTANAAGYEAQTLDITIQISAGQTGGTNLTGSLSYGASQYNYTQSQGVQTISTDSVPIASGGETVTYSISHKSGVAFNPAVEVNPSTGSIQVTPSTTETGIAVYTITASATGYNSQTVDITIQITSQTGLMGTLDYGETEFNYTKTQAVQTISPVTVPSAVGGETVTYSISHKSGVEFDPALVVDAMTAVIQVTPNTTLTGTAVYTITASAAGYSSQTVDLTIQITEESGGTNLTGTFTFSESEYSYEQNQGEQVIFPASVPFASGGETVTYSGSHSSGVEFNPPIIVDASSGAVQVYTDTSLTGSAVYTITASAAGYVSQTVDITIEIASQPVLTGNLSYGSDQFEYIQNQGTRTIPAVTVPSTTGGGETVSYSVAYKSGVELNPTIVVDSNTAEIQVDLNTTNTGTAVYTITASAAGYVSQTLDITVQISGQSDLTGILSYGVSDFSYFQDQEVQVIPTVTVPVASGGEVVSYSISHKSGVEFSPAIVVNPTTGELQITPNTTLAGSAVYTITASAAAYISQTLDITIQISALVDLSGTLSYGAGQFNYFQGQETERISKDSVLSASGGEAVVYSISHKSGVEFSPAIDLNSSTGELTVNLDTTNTGTAVYTITASATGYVTQTVDLTIQISALVDLTNTLSYGAGQFNYFQGQETERISADSVPSASGGEAVVYSISHKSGVEFSPAIDLNSSTGELTVNLDTINTGTAVYTITASTTGYVTQTVDITIQISALVDLSGTLSYGAGQFNYFQGQETERISKDSVLSASGGEAVVYSISHKSGVEFSPAIDLNSSTGELTVNLDTTNTGTAVYTITASATGYVSQTVDITIQISALVDLTNTLSYGAGQFNYFQGQETERISKDSVLSASGGEAVVYSISHKSGVEFSPAIDLNSSTGELTVNLDTINTGTAVYTITASATGYVTQTVDLTIQISALVDLTNTLSYGAGQFNYFQGQETERISKDSVLSASGGEAVVYSISHKSGVEFSPAIDLNSSTGELTVNLDTTNTGTAVYTITASATGYVTQTVDLTIQISAPVDFTNTLSYGGDQFVYYQNQAAQTIRAATVPTASGGETIAYSITHKSGIEFSPPASVDRISGEISVTPSERNIGKAVYTITASATGYVTQTVDITIDILALSDFTGSLSYAQSAYSFVIGTPQTLNPSTVPSATGSTLSYTIRKTSGADFSSLPTISGSGVITIAATTNTGTAIYGVEVSSTGYNTQTVELTITITPRPPSGVSNVLISSIVETSFTVGWDAPTDAGTAQDGTPIQANEIVYRVYTLVATEGQATPSASELLLNPSASYSQVIGSTTSTITGLTSSTRYFVQVAIYNATTDTTYSSDVIEAKTGGLTIKVYHDENAISTSAVELGQSVKDATSKLYSLEDSDIILELGSLAASSVYYIKYGSDANSFPTEARTKISNAEGVVTLNRSELENLPNQDGTTIGISGPGLSGTAHVATYRPANIYSKNDLQAMRHNLNGDYVLQKDIAFTALTDKTINNFETIGNLTSPFTGTLDGNNKSISNLQIHITDVGTGNYQGLFGVVESTDAADLVAQNLELIDFTITVNSNVGSLAGWLKKGTVDNVDVKVSSAAAGEVVANGHILDVYTFTNVGGLVGRSGTDVAGTQVTIQNSSSETAVHGKGLESHNVGGLVGLVNSDVTISGSYVTGEVEGKANNVGGLAGYNNGSLTNGYATGDVTGKTYTGGLIGFNDVNATATGYYTTGLVKAADRAGGLIGQNYGTVSGYVDGDVEATNNDAGGLVGWNEAGSMVGYSTGDVKAASYSGGGLAGFNKATLIGYATGTVSVGLANGGGLVGYNEAGSSVNGYFRGIVRRLGGGSTNFGATIGAGPGPQTTYSSSAAGEAKIYSGAEGVIEFGGTGSYGTAVSITSTTTATEEMTKSLLPDLTFTANSGDWTWVAAGQWPAINIGDTSPTSSQPTGAIASDDGTN